MNIVVVGLGYVGTANLLMLAPNHKVIGVDLNPERVAAIEQGTCPVFDPDAAQYIAENRLDLSATLDGNSAYEGADVVIVATPTDYAPQTNRFNTQSVESVVRAVVNVNSAATIVIRSTVPVGFVRQLRAEIGSDRIVFVPEFLREGRALHDSLHPSRIVVGDNSKVGKAIADLLLTGVHKKDVPLLLTGTDEAEAIKLFANTYLAMRIAYFNELDSYAMVHELNTKQIIDGVGLDQRIGDHYNNPSFGFGGYCLPKDTKQLLANYANVPQNLIEAIIQANQTRKDVIAEEILKRKPYCVGIYRLTMKMGSDNFRDSAVQGIVERIKLRDVKVLIFEPMLEEGKYYGSEVTSDFSRLVDECDVIVANRMTPELEPLKDRVFTRDVFGNN